jgi:hypothetical protein
MMKHSNRHKQCHDDTPPKSPNELYDEYKKRNGKHADK